MFEHTGTFLQIDLQNIFMMANRGQKLDLEKVYDHFTNRETEFLIGAIIYTAHGYDFDSSRFEVKLKSIGFEVKTKDVMKNPRRQAAPACLRCRHYRGEKNPSGAFNMETLITTDCISRINNFDKWILISNNSNYLDVCKYVKSQSKKIEIWGLRDCYDPQFDLYADKIHFLDDEFCLKRKHISVFGMNIGPEELIYDSTAVPEL